MNNATIVCRNKTKKQLNVPVAWKAVKYVKVQVALATLTLLLIDMHYEKCLLYDNIASFKTNHARFLCRKLARGYCYRELKAM